MDNEMIFSVWLSLISGAADPFAWEAYERFGSCETACRELFGRKDANDPLLTDKYRMRAVKYPFAEAQRICGLCEKGNIRIVRRFDDDYPPMLNDIDVPPFLLYYRGSLDALCNEQPMLAMVGARYPTDYSMKAAASLSRDLARCGFGIVSGFAVGTDIVCQLAACAAGGATYSVLGCGLDHNYPKQNFQYREIITAHGAMISEYPPDQSPRGQSYPVRNRILAGLACGAAVIEAGAESGSLITANHASDQGKTVFVMPPGDIFNRAYSGNVKLIRAGAPLIMSARDIVNEYFPQYGHKLTATAAVFYADAACTMSLSQCAAKAGEKAVSDTDGTKALAEAAKDSSGKKPPRKKRVSSDRDIAVKIAGKNVPVTEEIEKPSDEPVPPPWEGKLTPEQQICADILRKADRPLTADEISEEAGTPAPEMLTLLTEMELDGIVRGGAGKTFTLAE